MQQINIVISGFTPYEGIDVNPAVLVPAAVAKQWADPAQSQAISEELLQDIAVTVTNVTLPVSFAKAWPTLLEAIEQAKPDIVIATGLKRTSRGILLERCATNLMDAAKPDADNVIPSRRPIPAALSSDAGTFVCNSLFYHLLNWSAGQERRILSGFVSLPIVNGRPHERGLSIEQQTAAVDDVLRESVRYFLQPSSSDILLG